MKQYIFAVVILLNVAFQKCEKKAENSIPACIQLRIDEIKRQPRWNPPAQVEEYNYGGRRVFLFSSNCCDQYNGLYDEDCKYICAPSGGMTGKGDRKCEDFQQAAKLVRIVWKDDR